ncbi:hypothetical protein RMS29_028435 (plasmid) [Agrobacterium rosae]|uniref:Uncharacterized protein n=1 Tax=Agrobacterium rosae TaxID=1972867 RepID=A0ABU4W7Y8_9HYPH|nr:hypothetical protein [Agrobacterium rosae]MDX8332865.1 hypothetical protein [Agrobacterium rosae]
MATHRINAADKARLTTEMAQFMRDNEPCTRDDLLTQFAKHEVETCHDDARDEAHRLSDQRRAA